MADDGDDADGADDNPGDKQDGMDGPDGSMDGADDGDDPGDGDSPDDGDGDDPGDGDGPDAGPLDPDASLPDAALPDASLPVDPPPVGPFQFLSEAGLYSDIENHVIAPGVLEFEPEFKLWSDGAEKRRWIRLPPGTQITTTNMASWRFPAGTIVYKEFSDPLTGKRLETRLIQRLPDTTFYFASFIWNEDDTEAVFDATPSGPTPPVDIPDGCAECTSPPCDDFPTSCHVVPKQSQCNECHGGETHRVLGFSAVQLSHDGPGVTLIDLADLGLLSNPPPAGVDFPVPGVGTERAAIGYLHANCGHCHAPTASHNACHSLTNPGGAGGMQARVVPSAATVEETQIYQSAVGQPLRYWISPEEENHTASQLGELITERILPGDAERSAVWYRMSVREFGQLPPFNDHQQMPTVGTHEVDEAGLDTVEAWINSL